MYVLLLVLSPFLAVMGAVALAACVRSTAKEALSACAVLALVAAGVALLIAATADEDTSSGGQSRWSAHPGSHGSFEVLLGLLLLVCLAKVLSRESSFAKWLAPPALLMSAASSFWLFTALSH